MKTHRFVLTFWILFSGAFLVFAGETVDLQVISQIKTEGFDNSHVMETMSYLTDVHGPRLTNSPNYFSASQWCVDKLTEWGAANARLEPWGVFGRGWTVERFSIAVTAPQFMSLIAYPKAWTPGTNGVVSGTPLLVNINSDDDFATYRGKLAGAIVMAGDAPELEPHFEAEAKRHSEEDLARLLQAPEPGGRSPWEARRGEFRKRRELQNKIDTFFLEEGVAVVLEPSERDYGTIRVHRGGSYKIGAEPAPRAVVLAAEHYARLVRLLEKNIAVQLEVNIQTKFFLSTTRWVIMLWPKFLATIRNLKMRW